MNCGHGGDRPVHLVLLFRLGGRPKLREQHGLAAGYTLQTLRKNTWQRTPGCLGAPCAPPQVSPRAAPEAGPRRVFEGPSACQAVPRTRSAAPDRWPSPGRAPPAGPRAQPVRRPRFREGAAQRGHWAGWRIEPEQPHKNSHRQCGAAGQERPAFDEPCLCTWLPALAAAPRPCRLAVDCCGGQLATVLIVALMRILTVAPCCMKNPQGRLKRRRGGRTQCS